MKLSEAMKKGLVVANKNGVKQGHDSSIIPTDFATKRKCCVLGLVLLGKYGFKRVCAMAKGSYSIDKFYNLIFKHFPTVNNSNVSSIYHLNDTLHLSFEKCIEEVEKMEAEGFF